MSHLLQMRGLKPKNEHGYETLRKSHLLQMRGLKQIQGDGFTSNAGSHLLQMRGLKHYFMCHIDDQTRRIFYRCVD